MTSNDLAPLPPNFAKALELIDEVHAEDPRVGTGTPYELHYARKMTRWLATRCPDASPVLQLACRAQHFKRWEIPRTNYPANRAGYLTWRAKLKSLAATHVTELLASASIPATGTQHVINPPLTKEEVERVAALIRKEKLSSDPETQVLEDVACLVFLDDQFDDFEARDEIDEEKMVSILQKTWGKMSEKGREIAVGMDLSERAKALIGKALG